MRSRRKPEEVTKIFFDTVHEHIGHIVNAYRVRPKQGSPLSHTRTVVGTLESVVYSAGATYIKVSGVEYEFLDGSKLIVY